MGKKAGLKLLYKGAEAEIYLDREKKEIIKKRISKKYRIKELDEELRKMRTRKEAKMMHLAKKAGAGAPFVKEVEMKNCTIKMSYIEGERFRDFLNSAAPQAACKETCRKVGEAIGRLHANNLIHGDLTASNILLKDGRIFFIDFGLSDISTAVENKGADLLVLKKALRSAHYDKEEFCMKAVLEGYRKENKEADRIIERMNEIEKRGRYFAER